MEKNKLKKSLSPLETESKVAEAAVSYTINNRISNVAKNNSESKGTFERPISLLGLSFTSPYKEVQNDFDYIECIRTGLPKKALDNIMQIAGFNATEIAGIIHTSDRTLRRYTPKQKLDHEQSERVLELAKLYSRGEEVFGTIDSFKTWMDREIMALGNKKPKAYLDTSLGIEMLMDELGRIEHGVFA